MTKTRIQENTGGLGTVEGKRRWRSRIIAEGPGSSGYYSKEVLEAFGPIAFPAGTRMNIDHQSPSSEWDQPAGTLNTLAGILTSPAEWQESPKPGLYANIEVSEKWAPFVEQFKDVIGLSIRAAATISESDVDEASGKPLVTAITPHVLNTVDFVTVPGADGRIIGAIESWYDTMSVDTVSDISQEEEKMVTIDEIREAFEEVLGRFVAEHFSAAEQQSEQDKARENAISDAFSKVIESGLTDVNQKSIIREFEADLTLDVDTAIEKARVIEDAIRESVKPDVKEVVVDESRGRYDTGKVVDYGAEFDKIWKDRN